MWSSRRTTPLTARKRWSGFLIRPWRTSQRLLPAHPRTSYSRRMAIQLVDMPVTKVVQETPDTRTFRLESPPNFDYDWKPGQFITVNLPDDPKTRRAYSISSSPLDGRFLEITIK